MSAIDRFRRAADYGRKAADRVGVRTTSVTIRVETWSAPIDTAGATLSNVSETVLSPRPKVRQASLGDPSYFGGDLVAMGSGPLHASVYTVGPITLNYQGGGYSGTQLLPVPPSPTTRTVVVMAGDDFDAPSEVFEIVDMDASRPNQVTLTVRRTRQ